MEQATPELMRRECELEKEAVGLGQGRYYSTLAARGLEESQPGGWMIKKMITPLAAEITQWVKDAEDGKASRNAGLALFLSQFDPFDVAFITARKVVASFDGTGRLTNAAMGLTRMLEEASMSDALRKADPKAWKRLQTKIERCPYPNKRYILTRKAMGQAQVKRISWSLTDRVRLGVHLIALCADTSGAFTIEARFVNKNHSVNFLVPHQETLDKLAEAHERCALNSPWYLPMVVPPRPWTTLRDGGYLDTRGLRRWLVNSHALDKSYIEALKEAPMPMVYEAVNAVQATPWRINRRVHEVLRDLWDAGSTLGKLPARDNLPLPSAPWTDEPDHDTDEYKAHRASLARTHEANGKLRGKRLALQSKLYVADKFSEYDAIYFPHCVDFRGRLYPVPPLVNPQADDTGRAMLEFAAGVELGEDGAWWLAIHGANTFGFDKVPFDNRVQWVEEHQDAIRDSALNPLDGERFWCGADDPFMFLAFCFEWAKLQDWVGSGQPQEQFSSHLPVAWDGSCNGLQNFSAMLRDPIGGAATNLVPSPTPADIYQRVADVASAQVERDAANGEVNAVYWKGKVARKIAKRPTMTLPYGSGRYGFRDQLRSELQKIRLDEGQSYIKGDEFLCSMYLANVLYDALSQVVVAARTAMDWLKDASKPVAAAGMPVRWTAPTGFIVQQEYHEQLGQVANCTVGGRRYQVLVHITTDKIDKRKQAQGISPNFVHSLDAAHLMRTVSLCREAGVVDFAMVHDSYGTHAGNAAIMHAKLREAFVAQYSGNVLADLRLELLQQVPEADRDKVPGVPPQGDLDLTAVLQSEYFFA